MEQGSQRLKMSATKNIKVVAWQHKPVSIWTDGSVQEPDAFWHTRGGYAFVDSEHNVSYGPVFHPSLTSYCCELWAILNAVASAAGPCVIHTDSLTIVDQFRQLTRTGVVCHTWSMVSWWQWLHNHLQHRKQFHPEPLQLFWCPSRCAEDTPDHLLSQTVAEKT